MINKENQQLLALINELYPAGVQVVIGNKEDDSFTFDDYEQYQLDGRIVLDVNNAKAGNIIIFDLLSQMLLNLTGDSPAISYNLHVKKEKDNGFLMTMLNKVYQIAQHSLTLPKAKQLNMIDDEIIDQYYQGLDRAISENKSEHFKILALVDALVFGLYSQADEKYLDSLEEKYGQELAFATPLAQVIKDKTFKDNRDIRNLLINLYAYVDDVFNQAGLSPLGGQLYVTIAPVMSERQLNQKVEKHFRLFKATDLLDDDDKQPYVGLGINDNQNAFNVTIDEDKDLNAQAMYIGQMTVKELFDDLKMPYCIRK